MSRVTKENQQNLHNRRNDLIKRRDTKMRMIVEEMEAIVNSKNQIIFAESMSKDLNVLANLERELSIVTDCMAALGMDITKRNA